MEFFYLAIGLFVGTIIVWLGMKSKLTKQNGVLQQKLAESERLIGQLYAENAFLKKVLTSLEAKLQEHQKQREGN